MKHTRRYQGNSLAFLDVMACGLGAAVLLFLIVKHNTGSAVEPEPKPDIQLQQSAVLANLIEERERLSKQIEVESQKSASEEKRQNENQKKLEAKNKKIKELQNLTSKIEQQKNRKSTLREDIVRIQPQQSTAIIDNPQIGEEDYLIGLKVEGRRIAILIDHSASMTDNLLIALLIRKNRSDSAKKQGPKWKRTIRVANWLLARLPKDGEVAVVAFNDQAKKLGKGTWTDNRDRKGIQDILLDIEKLVPTNATNLAAGLNELFRLSPQPTDVYLVTDGLPTKGASLGILTGCRANSQTISGDCRKKLFRSSIRNYPSSQKVNVILMPLEGDPEGAPEFWEWTSATGGLLLVPSQGWP